MARKPKLLRKRKAVAKAPRKLKAKAVPATTLTGGPKAGTAELSALEATIRSMDAALNAHGTISPQRQDSELRGVLTDYQHIRPSVMARLNRVKQRAQE